ncbi:MAG TPA: ribonuclease HI family protein [Candidatus Omnitrophota bacterium]|nr:ribonuclease HI family protein [Candidatus Omnitrophota bacterium]HRZ15074.1 ribonuclease HI family protein [Candidatus Omnitrophota bacterium]
MNKLDIYIDGASKGNPGPSGIGVIILKDGQSIRTISRYIGTATNNIAEYSALIAALEESLLLKAEQLTIKSDSELLCRQLNRQYKVKSEHIRGLFEQATRLISGFKHVSVCHIPREENAGADKLATRAVTERSQR